MKIRITFFAAVLALAAISFAGCSKSVPETGGVGNADIRTETEDSETGSDFTVAALVCAPAEEEKSGNPSTKTVNNGLQTGWAAEDALNVFHVPADGTAYVKDGKFQISDIESGSFTGTLGGELEEGTAYDWYALYPYSSAITSLDAAPVTLAGAAQTQTGNGSKAHLAGADLPLFGSVKSVEGTPTFSLSQLASVVKLHLTNGTDGAITVNDVVFTAPEAVAGVFTADLTGDSPTFTPDESASSAVTLTVADGGEIAAGESADFFIAVKPFTASAGSKLKIAVNGYEKEVTTTADIAFKAGIIKKVNFSYNPEIVIGQEYSSASGYECALNEQSLSLSVTVPDGFDASAVVWESSDEDVATVDGGTVTYKGFGTATITASLPGVRSGSIDLSIPCGLIRETFHNSAHYCAYDAEQSGNSTSTSHEWNDGYLEITTYLQSNTAGEEQQRADIKWYCTPLYFHAGNYPVIAVKMDDVQELYSSLGTITQRRINLDARMTDGSSVEYSGNLGGDNNKYLGDLKCSDGSHVFIYNLATQKFKNATSTVPTDGTLTVKTFQFKYADIKVAASQLTYKLYWIQSFKTVEDVKAYVTKVDGLTYEVKK